MALVISLVETAQVFFFPVNAEREIRRIEEIREEHTHQIARCKLFQLLITIWLVSSCSDCDLLTDSHSHMERVVMCGACGDVIN